MMKFVSLLASALIVSSVCFSEEPRPNVLLICVDDLRTELGCYDSEIAISPNIDRLSASGVTFENCYVQVAVCNPSRASMMTGLRPDTLRCWTLDYHFRETRPKSVTLPQYLREHGYHAEGYGKIFHNPWPDPRSWSRRHRFGPGDWNHYTDEQEGLIARVQEELPDDDWRKNNLRGPIGNEPDIEDSEHPDAAMAGIVVDRLAALKKSDKPFFLAAGFVLPHLPWCPPKKYWDLYNRDTLPLADHRDLPRDIPDVALGTNYEFTHYADALDTPTPLEGAVSDTTARLYRHAYLASVSFVDAQVGRILDALDTNDLAEKTIVVLWSDHGYKLGEHQGWGKMTNSEFDTRIPFIVRDPRAEANGKRSKRLVETLDLFPTICELAGVSAPDFTEGESFARLLDEPDAEHIDAAFSQYIYKPLIGASIRTNEWRYTEWRDMKDGAVKHTELYDHRGADHAENANLAGNQPEIEASLAEQLRLTLPADPVEILPEIHSAKGGEKSTVEFVNRHPGEVRLTWISPQGKRAQQYDLSKGKARSINTFVGHVFVAESLDGRYHEIVTVPKDSTRIELGSKLRRGVAKNLSPSPADWNVPDFYDQAISANGYPIVASETVSPFALKEAAWIVDGMLSSRPDVRSAMIDGGSRLCILGHGEFTTDLPEFAKLQKPPAPEFADLTDQEYWDVRARGTGGSRYDPYCSCGEENLLSYPGDPYVGECILIHEFAHAIHWRGLMEVDDTFDTRLRETYDKAIAAGLWRGTYAGTNHAEYFAEGVQSWFNDNRENDHEHNHVNTRAELKEYDSGLAALLEEVFGEPDFQYTPPKQRVRDHLEGYDPSIAPTFVWPKRLEKAYAVVFEKPIVLPIE